MRKTHLVWNALPIAMLAAVMFLVLRAPSAADGAISPAEAATLIKQKKNLQLIDVRTAAEYADGHLAGAKLIPVQEIEQRLAEIDKQQPVLLYCRTGHRSGNALRILHDQGFAAKHMAGGIQAWQAASLPVTK